jgi:hypothetical protein
MHSKWVGYFCGLVISILLASCNRYSISLNEKVVYTPAPLFKDYPIADMQLKNCVEQTIEDLHITQVGQLHTLNCSDAAIESLQGLDKFFALEELNLAGNKITSIADMKHLGKLKLVILRNNNIVDAAPALHLLHIKKLDLAGNQQLRCEDLQQLIENLKGTGAEIIAPTHCLQLTN